MTEPSNPQVSVFHFTNKISSAKIRKYRLATERGMSSGNPSGDSTPDNTTPAPEVTLVSIERSSKRRKLGSRINLQDSPAPAALGDSIAATRPKRDSTLRIRYSDNMVLSAEDRANAARGDSSELSSLENTPNMGPQGPDREPSPMPVDEDYGSFSSYYIAADDPPPPAPAPAAQPPPAQQPRRRRRSHTQAKAPVLSQAPEPQAQAQQPNVQYPMDPPPRQTTQFKHHVPQQNHPPPQPMQHLPPPPPPVPPQVPRVILMDLDIDQTQLQQPATVNEMIEKIDTLAYALTSFGGVPPMPKPVLARKKTKAPKASKGSDNPLDTFLGHFEGSSSSDEEEDEEEGEEEAEEGSPLDCPLQRPGQPDEKLIFGIEFIQNALKSWAQQRMQLLLANDIMHKWTHEQQQIQRRGPGRPRKFDQQAQQMPPGPVHMSLLNQPEGIAIRAFQECLRSGALQINTPLPKEMSDALRQLYSKIDHLINQGPKQEADFVCMSYGAQIAANRSRVEKAKLDLARAEEDFMRQQQQISQQYATQQQPLNTCLPPYASFGKAQYAHVVELERRRNSQAGGNCPGQSVLNPIVLGSQPSNTAAGFVPSPSPTNGTLNGQRQMQPTSPNGQDGSPNGMSAGQQAAQAKGTLFSRSGHKMKFSFPGNEQALRVFGPESFPNPNLGLNIPNRGPMPGMPLGSMPPPMPMPQPQPTPADVINGAIQAPLDRSVQDAANMGEINSHAHAVDDVATRSTTKPTPTPDSDELIVVTASRPITNGGFTAVNAAPRAGAGSSPTVVSSPKAVDKMSRCKSNNTTDVVTKYPHPGAVVVDQ